MGGLRTGELEELVSGMIEDWRVGGLRTGARDNWFLHWVAGYGGVTCVRAWPLGVLAPGRAARQYRHGLCRVFTAAAEPGSPPRPESVPVLRPFTVQDTIRLATVSARQRKADDTSMIVNVDAMSERTDPDLVVNGAAGDTDPAGAKSEAKSASGTSTTAADAAASTDAKPASSSEAADAAPAADAAATDAPADAEKSEQPSSDAAGADAAKTDADAKTTAADGADGKKEDGDRLVVRAAHCGVSAPGRALTVSCAVSRRASGVARAVCSNTHCHSLGTSARDAVQALSTGGLWAVSGCLSDTLWVG